MVLSTKLKDDRPFTTTGPNLPMYRLTSDLNKLKPLLNEIINECNLFIQQIAPQIFCCTLKTKKELQPFIQKLPLIKEKIDNLLQVLELTTTSFSWGKDDVEVVILVFDNPEEAFSLSKTALAGLFLHEMMHCVQRQRGLEDDLHRSLNLSLDFFTKLAEYIPEGHFPKDHLINFLKSIGKFAVLALKDLYVNTELIRRGRTLEVLTYHEMLLGLSPNIKSVILAPNFDNFYIKGKIALKSLFGLEMVINYTMSLLPALLPFSKLNRIKNEALKERGDRLRKQIMETYLSTLPEYMHEFLLLEDLYLTSFGFNEAFHRKFIGNFFNTVLELILGEDFVFYHMSKISELIDLLYQDNPKEKKEILSPLLKAAYHLFIIRGESGIQKENCDLLQGLVSKTISKDEMEEFREFMETDPDVKITDLLEMTFFRLVLGLRDQLLEGYAENLLIFCRALLLLLHVMRRLNPVKQEYLRLKKLIYQLINHKRRLFYRVLFMGKLELLAKQIFFNLENSLTCEEFEELMFTLQYFGIIVDNDVFDLVVVYSNAIKMSLATSSPDDLNFPIIIALTCNLMAFKTIKSSDTRENALPILRAVLLSLGYSFKTVRKVAREFGPIFNDSLDEELKNDIS
ncbi:MAG: hypothetical protein ACFFDI_11240 [Promethearchaeota archaeon]